MPGCPVFQINLGTARGLRPLHSQIDRNRLILVITGQLPQTAYFLLIGPQNLPILVSIAATGAGRFNARNDRGYAYATMAFEFGPALI